MQCIGKRDLKEEPEQPDPKWPCKERLSIIDGWDLETDEQYEIESSQKRKRTK